MNRHGPAAACCLWLVPFVTNASKTKLTSVSANGDATARSIIEHRPYSDATQVVEKTILSQEVLDKLKAIDRGREAA
jgi:hypothetical protein